MLHKLTLQQNLDFYLCRLIKYNHLNWMISIEFKMIVFIYFIVCLFQCLWWRQTVPSLSIHSIQQLVNSP